MKGMKNLKKNQLQHQETAEVDEVNALLKAACFYLNNKGIERLTSDIQRWCNESFDKFSLIIVTSQLKPSFFKVIEDLQSTISNHGLVFIAYDPEKRWLLNPSIFEPKRDTPRFFGVIAFDNQILDIYSEKFKLVLQYQPSYQISNCDKNQILQINELSATEALHSFLTVRKTKHANISNGKILKLTSLLFNTKNQIKTNTISLVPEKQSYSVFSESCEPGDSIALLHPSAESFVCFLFDNFHASKTQIPQPNPIIQSLENTEDLIFFLTDIHACLKDFKQSPPSLRNKENRKKSERQNLVESAEIVYFATDASANITYLNKAWKKVTGFSKEDCLGQPLGNYIYYRDKKKHLIPLSSPQNPSQIVNEQIRLNTAAGGQEWVNIQFSYIFDEDNNFAGSMGTMQRSPQAETAVSGTNQLFFQSALDQVSDFVFTINEDLKISFINKSLIAFFKANGLNLPTTGRKLINMYPLLGERYEQEFRSVLHTGQPVENEKTISLNKKEYVFLVRKAPVMYQNRIIGIICSMKDISVQKELKLDIELQKASIEKDLSEKTRLLATMSHEIRTPMNGVNGLTELLLETKLSREQRHLAESIKSSSESLLGIINDVLDYSRIESGKMQLQRHRFNIATCLDEIFDLFSNISREKALEITYFLDPKLPENLVGDSHRFRQILVNLIGNAVKFTSKGGVEVEIYKKHEDAAEVIIEASVKDTGIGISRGHFEKLFVPFSQLNDRSNNKLAGSGLGLAITKSLVEIMGGKINVSSIPGKGSTFTFSTVFFNPGITQPIESKSSFLRKPHIILYSSNHAIARSGKRLFEIAGYSCSRAASTGQLKQLLADNPLEKNLVWDIPSGKKATDDLFRKFSSLLSEHKLKIFLLTSHAEIPPLLEKMVEGFIPKPLRLHKIKEHEAIFSHEKENGSQQSGFQYKLDGDLAAKLPLKILVAEDDPVNLMLMKKIFQYMGYKPDLASDGKQVLELIHKRHYNLLFMDLKMPEMDGLEATRTIRESFPVSTRPKIIACTANILSAKEEFFVQNGFDDFIFKPINIGQIQKAIIKWGSKS